MDTFVFFSVQMTHANRVAEWGEKSFGFRSLSFSAWQLEISPFFQIDFDFFFVFYFLNFEREKRGGQSYRSWLCGDMSRSVFPNLRTVFFLFLNSLSVLSSLSSRRRRHCLISWRAAKKSKMKLFVYPSKSWKTCWMPFCIFKFSFFFFFWNYYYSFNQWETSFWMGRVNHLSHCDGLSSKLSNITTAETWLLRFPSKTWRVPIIMRAQLKATTTKMARERAAVLEKEKKKRNELF